MKKIMALILAALMLVSFAACAAEPAEENKTEPAEGKTVETKAEENKDEEKKEIAREERPKRVSGRKPGSTREAWLSSRSVPFQSQIMRTRKAP